MSSNGKRAVAEAGAQRVQDGMLVGLGSGTTVLELVEVLGRLRPAARYVASSPLVEARALQVGLPLVDFMLRAGPSKLDLALDGADQVADDGWVLKGRGGAHTRERLVARAAGGVVLLVTHDKCVKALTGAVPVEVLRFGRSSTLEALSDLGAVSVRDAPATPDGGVLVDVAMDLSAPARAAAALARIPGVVDHGLFGPDEVSGILVARDSDVTTR